MRPIIEQNKQPIPFWIIVEEFVGAANLGITTGCRQQLEPFVERGDQSVPYQSAQRARAVANLGTFLVEMIEDTIKRRYHELTEETFAAVHKRLCPLFPFC
jgi:hypothetical protein